MNTTAAPLNSLKSNKKMNDDKSPNGAESSAQAAPESNEDTQAEWSERAPLTAAFLRQFDAARNKLTAQLEAGQKNIDDLQKRALDVVEQVQTRAGKVGEKVREEGKEATTKLDGLRKNLGGKLPLKIDLESWLNLPLEAREEVLAVLGIASDKRVAALQASIDTLRDESIVLVEAQTAVLKEIIEQTAKAASRDAAARKPAAAKTAAAETAASGNATTRKAPARKQAATKTAPKSAARKTAAPAKTAPKAAPKTARAKTTTNSRAK